MCGRHTAPHGSPSAVHSYKDFLSLHTSFTRVPHAGRSIARLLCADPPQPPPTYAGPQVAAAAARARLASHDRRGRPPGPVCKAEVATKKPLRPSGPNGWPNVGQTNIRPRVGRAPGRQRGRAPGRTSLVAPPPFVAPRHPAAPRRPPLLPPSALSGTCSCPCLA